MHFRLYTAIVKNIGIPKFEESRVFLSFTDFSLLFNSNGITSNYRPMWPPHKTMTLLASSSAISVNLKIIVDTKDFSKRWGKFIYRTN